MQQANFLRGGFMVLSCYKEPDFSQLGHFSQDTIIFQIFCKNSGTLPWKNSLPDLTRTCFLNPEFCSSQLKIFRLICPGHAIRPDYMPPRKRFKHLNNLNSAHHAEPSCSGYHYSTTSLFKSCSRRVGDSRWWGSLTMVSVGNKAKHLSSVNHTMKTTHHLLLPRADPS